MVGQPKRRTDGVGLVVIWSGCALVDGALSTVRRELVAVPRAGARAARRQRFRVESSRFALGRGCGRPAPPPPPRGGPFVPACAFSTEKEFRKITDGGGVADVF
ncbi:hypothetical protein EVAR_84253_1 [Eumeta japonica]|uniref:Uncharacterized protein n=1 Tax=Eumeta variegata TaxID=151549 RepID=A0A4C1WU86_EUMVA|nr:hypothetical protein EVAR_84253_1 [Eumeta japonica]